MESGKFFNSLVHDANNYWETWIINTTVEKLDYLFQFVYTLQKLKETKSAVLIGESAFIWSNHQSNTEPAGTTEPGGTT